MERQRSMLVRLCVAVSFVVVCACDQRVEESAEQPGLVGVEWHLVAIETDEGSVIPTETDGGVPTLLFTDESADEEGARRLSGSGGCNRFFGSYETISAGDLSVSPLGATRMMCAEVGVMELETAFFESLSNARSYSVEGGELTIRFAGGLLRLEQGVSLQRTPGG